jgi:hypothetical protein
MALSPALPADPPPFRAIEEFPEYSISEAGAIRGPSGKILSDFVAKGYPTVGLSTAEKKRVHRAVHRLVALAWLPPPAEGKKDVNHLDGNKTNYHASNLEWCSHADNIAHAYASGLLDGKKKGKGVEAIAPDGMVRAFSSVSEAARELGLAPSGSNGVAMDRPSRSAAGHQLRSVETEDKPNEEWREFANYGDHKLKFNYQISSLGRAKGPRGLLHGANDQSGYAFLKLRGINGEQVNAKVHRIVAGAFLGPRPSATHIVDHVDGSARENNTPANLRWVTPQENTIAAIGKPVLQLDDSRQIVARFDSASMAAKAFGKKDATALRNAARKEGKYIGFTWIYEGSETGEAAAGASDDVEALGA